MAVELVTPRLVVRTPQRGDGRHYAEYYTRNQDFLQPWSPTFRPEMYSAVEWEASIPIIQQQLSQGVAIRFGLWQDQGVIGVANLTDIKLSPLYSCLLGYTLSHDAQGKGLMHEALDEIVRHMFQHRHMHRIVANYMPHNVRSGALLRKLGFEVEGYARDYLLIDGRWQDHVLAAKGNPNWSPPEDMR
jgi:[ribosomal protein S5]-alanine N-acetyltransferase